MSDNWILRALVFAVIVLFIGAGVVPSISGTLKDENDQTIRNDISTSSTSVEYETYIENKGLLDTISFDKGLQSNSETNHNTILKNNDNNDNNIEEVNMLNKDGDWLWVKRAGGTDYDVGRSVSVDGNGNTYITGRFQYTADFGPYNLTSQGGADVFIAKLNTNGDWQWAKRAGGTNADGGRGISVDGNGNTYITGVFEDAADFGPYNLTSQGGADVFIAKMNSDGDWQWAKRAGGTDNAGGNGVSVDGNGNTYITGFFCSTADFGPYNLTSQGGADVFIAKMNSNGDWQWAKRAGGTDTDVVRVVSVDGNGNIYITGNFYVTADFGPYNLTSQGSWDVFIAKLNTNGDWQWAKRAGGTNADGGKSVSVDGNGNIYITGLFGDTADFGPYNLTDQGSWDVFIAKLNTNGDWQWAKRAGGTDYDIGRGISVDGNGNIYITGCFYSTADFGPYNLTSQGSEDVFIAKMNSDGDWQWAKRAGGTNADEGRGISVDGNGNIYITGEFEDTADFGPYNLTSQGSEDVFIAKLSNIEGLDIIQSTFNRGFPVRAALGGDWGAAQNFTPTLSTLTGVDIYLRKFGTPDFDLVVELREDAIDGALLDTITFTPGDIAGSWNYVNVDFDDVTVTPGTDYFIKLPSGTGSNSYGYEWGYCFGNVYDDGAFWFTRDGGGLWRPLPTMYEFVFRTYGYN